MRLNYTGIATATVKHFPGGEVTVRVKNQSARTSTERPLGTLRKFDGERGIGCWPRCELNLDINTNSSEGPKDEIQRPAARTRNGVRPAVIGTTVVRKAALNRLRRCCAAIGASFDASSTAFVTFTLPGSSPDAVRVFSEWQGYLVHRLAQWLKDNFSIGNEVFYVSKWEYQRRSALHCHLLLVLPKALREPVGDGGVLPKLQQKCLGFWKSVVDSISRGSGVDICGRADGKTWKDRPEKWQLKALQPRDVGRYMAKYLSKEVNDSNTKTPLSKRNIRYKMSRAWSVSRGARKLLAKLTISYSAQVSPRDREELVLKVVEVCANLAEHWVCVNNPYTQQVVGSHAFSSEPEELFGTLKRNVDEFAARRQRESIVQNPNHPSVWSVMYIANSDRKSADNWAKYGALSQEFKATINAYWEAGCPQEWVWQRETRHIKALADILYGELKPRVEIQVSTEPSQLSLALASHGGGERW